MFDMNNGNFEEYDIDQRESEQTNEVYQMYEEMMNLVQKGMKNMNDGDSSDASDNTANTPKEKKAKVGNHKKESPRVEKQYAKEAKQCGSTAVIALFVGNKLFVANVGDARAIMSRSGKALDLSVDHKAKRPDE